MVQWSRNQTPSRGHLVQTIVAITLVTPRVFLQLYIGLKGSCADIGVIATCNIPAGETLATIPRSSVLTASTSCAGAIIRNDREISELLEEGLSPWIPLILALMAEQKMVIQSIRFMCHNEDKQPFDWVFLLTTQGSSHWQPYLNLVPASQSNPPPLLWSTEEREQFLQGMGVYELVEDDLLRSLQDYENVALPFVRRHQELYNSVDKHSSKLFHKGAEFWTILTAYFIAIYSFYDHLNQILIIWAIISVILKFSFFFTFSFSSRICNVIQFHKFERWPSLPDHDGAFCGPPQPPQ